MKLAKILVITIILAVLSLTAFRYFSSRRSPQSSLLPFPPASSQISGLPEGWQEETSPGNMIKLVKQSGSDSIKPTIVLIKSKREGSLDYRTYVNRLLSGAKSAIPSLKIIQNETLSDTSPYTRFLKGSYLNNRQQINILQQITIQDDKVFTLTASYLPSGLEAEINSIMSTVSQELVIPAIQ
jgi:hypothetical protein